jgi:two-component system phosphate regulon response regulator OmpR
MLTSRGDLLDRIIGIEIGADDYLVKPVDLRELLARVSSVLRRYRLSIDASNDEAFDNQVAFGDCLLDIDAGKMFDADGQAIKITRMEFDLLRAFAENPGRVLSRDQLLDLAHNRDWDPFDRSIDIRIGRLRRKIERDPANPEIITTVHGAGYRFTTK